MPTGSPANRSCWRLGFIRRRASPKRAKTFRTWFFPVGDDIRDIVGEWVDSLRQDKGFDPDDPLFPKTLAASAPIVSSASRGWIALIGRMPKAIRGIFREAFERSGFSYVNPHS